MKKTKSLKWACNQFVNRSLHDISYKLDRGIAKPVRIGCSLTVRCNIKCLQCSTWKLPRQKELTTQQWKNIILNFKSWLGTCRILFTGGEPFIRKDLLELIKYSTDNGIIAGIATNAIMINPKLAQEIVDSGMGFVNISLDGVKPETHDFIRGIDGSFDKAVSGIRSLNKVRRDLSIFVLSIITNHNLDEILDLVKWVEDEGLDGINFQALMPAGDEGKGWEKENKLWIKDYNKLDYILDRLIQMKKEGAKIVNTVEQFERFRLYFRHPNSPFGEECSVGVTNIGIMSNGDVYLCFKMPSVGNATEETLEKIWTSERANKVRKAIRKCNIPCGPQNFNYRNSLLSDIIRYFKFI